MIYVDTLFGLLVVTHLLGMAAIVGSWMVAVRSPKVLPPMVYGAAIQLVTGLALVGLAASGTVVREVDDAKIAVKLVVALIVAFLVVLHQPKRSVSKGVLHAIGGLAVLNVLVAVLW